MARLPYLDRDDLAPEHQRLLDRPINLARITAHSPGGAAAFRRTGGWIRHKSKLDPRLREMAILRIGAITRTDYEYSHHIALGREFGLSDDDIAAVIAGPDNDRLDELESLILRAADEATLDLGVSDSTFAALAERLNAELLVEVTVVIAYYNAVIRLLRTLDVDVEPDYLTYLDEFPYPEADR